METFEPNSRKYKEEQETVNAEERKKLTKIVNGSVKTKKKGKVSKFFNNLVSEDASSIKSYIVTDVVIPSVKKAITETVDMILYGGSRGGRSSTNASRISYRSFYDRSYSDPRPREIDRVRTGYSFDDIILDSRGDAEQVLSQMNDLIDTYGVASVADLFDLVGISGNYTDNKYGWTNLRNAEVKRSRDGYILDMPKALPIK